MKHHEQILKALANQRRLMILKFLKKNKEASVAEISSEIKLSFKATSKHLNLLARADVIDREQRGMQRFYRLTATHPAYIKSLLNLL